jgi:acetyl esterase/lipase
MLIILRDQGLLLPAGAILISPWVDLTHSFPSVAGTSSLDYIPPHGFLQRPSAAWPPPNYDEMELIANQRNDKPTQRRTSYTPEPQETIASAETVTQGSSEALDLRDMVSPEGVEKFVSTATHPEKIVPRPSGNLSILLDGKLVEIKDQIQMHTTNQLLSHPLVSPVLQPSLGGLPPLLIMTGGGEMLRDEQIYLAHKAANPANYPPAEVYLDVSSEARDVLHKWKPTDVQLQVWDDLCHVAPTLSFTRPAKYMYRSIAQFGAWALARAQQTEIEIPDDDDGSTTSAGSDADTESISQTKLNRGTVAPLYGNVDDQSVSKAKGKVGKAGDALPDFLNHMVRQRVDRHGHIYDLAPASLLPAVQMPVNEIGVIKPGPVRKWLMAKEKWDVRFAKEKQRVQKQRMDEMVKGFEGFGSDESPPPSALAGRRILNPPQTEKKKMSWGMSLWSLWGSSHDEKAVCLVRLREMGHSNSFHRSHARREQITKREGLAPLQITG